MRTKVKHKTSLWPLAVLLLHGCNLDPGCPDAEPGLSEAWIEVGRQAEVADMLIADDGGTVFVGSRYSNPNPAGNFFLDAYVVKADADGHVQWTKFWDWGNFDEWASIQPSGDGGYYLAGVIGPGFSTARARTVIAKIDGNGEEVWSRVLTSDAGIRASSLSVNPDGTFVVAGNEGTNTLVAKFGADGSEAWRRLFDPSFALSIVATDDGGYVIAGQGIDGDLYVFKTDADGIVQWLFDEAVASEFSLEFSSGADVVETRDGGYAVACTVIDEEMGEQVFVAKFDSGGSVLWGTIAPEAPHARAFGILEAPDGSLVAGGEGFAFHRLFSSLQTCHTFYGVRLSESGQPMWSARLGVEIGTIGQAMDMNPDGQIVFAGSGYNGDDLIYTLTTDAGG